MDTPRHAYFMGKIVPFEEAKVSVATHAFNYGTAVFGGLRGYWNNEQKKMYVFRPQDHYRRLLTSAKMMCMESEHTPESLTEITLDMLKADGWQRDIYIRPLIYKSDLGLGVRLHNLTDAVTIFAWWLEAQKPTKVPNYLRTEYHWDCVQPDYEGIWTRYLENDERPLEELVKEAAETAQACLDSRYAESG